MALKRITDQFAQAAYLEAGSGQPRVLRARLAKAGMVNGRLYPDAVLRAAAIEAQRHIRAAEEQGGIGLLGEGSRQHGPRLLETIIVWKSIWFDESDRWVKGEGHVIETSIGQDAIMLMEAGVLPGICLQGYCKSTLKDEGIRLVEEVQWLCFTGFNLY